MLPNLDNEVDVQVLADTLEEAMKPIVEEMLTTMKAVRKAFPEVNETAFILHSVQYSMDKMREAVKEMTEGKESATSEEVVSLLSQMNDATAEERKELLSYIMTNSKFQSSILASMDREVFKAMNENLEELVGVSEYERKLMEEERKDREEGKRSGNRNNANQNARQRREPKENPIASTMKAIPSILDDVVASVRNLGIMFGAGGLFTMLPEKVQEFVKDFTTTFTYIRGLLNSSWLQPMMKILEQLPIFGTLLKKLPFLTAIFAGFEILPKMAKKFQEEGVWAALETGLQGVYDFFVKDVALLVAKFGNWIQEKFFGDTYVDLENVVNVFSEHAHKYATNMVRLAKGIWNADIEETLKGAGGMFANSVDAFVNAGLAAFGMPPDWSTEEKAKELWGAVESAYATARDAVVNATSGIGSVISSYVTGLIDRTTARWNAGLDAIGDFTENVSGFATSLMDTMTTKWNDAVAYVSSTASERWNEAVSAKDSTVAAITGMLDSASSWISETWTTGIKEIGDINARAGDTFSGILDSILAKITSVFEEAIASLSELKDTMKAWFTNLVKKTANYILDFLPMGMGEGMKFEIEEPKQESAVSPVKDPVLVEKRMISETKRLEDAKDKSQRKITGPWPGMNVDQSVRTNTTNYVASGPIQAKPASPLSSGSGGGGFWSWFGY